MKGGSRHWAGRKATRRSVNAGFRVTIGELQRFGILSGRVGHNESGVCFDGRNGDVRLVYRYRSSPTRGWKEVDERVAVTWTPCRYGGRRPWFVCPRCARRFAVLYVVYEPMCRACAGLTYPSQSADPVTRSWNRTTRLERRLAPEGGAWDGYTKPPGMHCATFSRLALAHRAEEERRAQLTWLGLLKVAPWCADDPDLPSSLAALLRRER